MSEYLLRLKSGYDGAVIEELVVFAEDDPQAEKKAAVFLKETLKIFGVTHKYSDCRVTILRRVGEIANDARQNLERGGKENA